MPEMDGLQFLASLPEGAPPVIMMSAYGSTETALEAVRRGAYDYVPKPFTADEVVLTLKKLEERENLAKDRGRLALENARLSERVGEPVEGFIGRSPLILGIVRTLTRVAPHATTVLITGESGTGKELCARALHQLSPRREAPFLAVNCAAIPENLLESELFGFVRGAFTGAVSNKPGLFEEAHKGTLLLDEIAELPAALQAKLLRVLEDGRIRRLGARADTEVDVRIVAATARSLTPPSFREDLYYRLAVVHIHLPPLRERPEDIPALAEHFLEALSARLKLPKPALDPETLRVLLRASWPGNVRQLENVLERAMLLFDGENIVPSDLPPEIQHAPAQPAALPSEALSIPVQTIELEKNLITAALSRTQGNKAAASRLLDISYKALLYKIRAYNLEP
jgi:two-component system response regulator AtoC